MSIYIKLNTGEALDMFHLNFFVKRPAFGQRIIFLGRVTVSHI